MSSQWIIMLAGVFMLIMGPYLYFQKQSGIKDRTYLIIITLGDLLVVYGLYQLRHNLISSLGKSWTWFILGIGIILVLLAGFDCVLALSGKMTRYEKHRLRMYEAAKKFDAQEKARQAHFKV